MHRLAQLDMPTSSDMRAPGAATGVYALECAMDELAVALKTDPVQFAGCNATPTATRIQDLPYSSKQLRECYRQGAAAFGWDKRNPEPRSMRDGSDLVGWGMATGGYGGAADAGRGPHRAHRQRACGGGDRGLRYRHRHLHDHGAGRGRGNMLGLPIDNISVKLGDLTLPQCPVEGGSWIAASVCHAIATTARAVRKELLEFASRMKDLPLAGADVDEVALVDGKLVSKRDASRAVPIASAMQHGNADRIAREEANSFEEDSEHAHNTHSAVFAEVKVDEELGVIRVTRVVDVVGPGASSTKKTAHSQVMGGVVWGIGMALHEEALFDHQFGRDDERQYRRVSRAC